MNNIKFYFMHVALAVTILITLFLEKIYSEENELMFASKVMFVLAIVTIVVEFALKNPEKLKGFYSLGLLLQFFGIAMPLGILFFIEKYLISLGLSINISYLISIWVIYTAISYFINTESK